MHTTYLIKCQKSPYVFCPYVSFLMNFQLISTEGLKTKEHVKQQKGDKKTDYPKAVGFT